MREQKFKDDGSKIFATLTPNLAINPSPQDYYYQEARQTLDQIECSLSELQKDPSNQDHWHQIKACAQNVSDLAMIHGYEGVENIANMIRCNSEQILRKEIELGSFLIRKFRLALEAIRQVMALEEEIHSQTKDNNTDKKIELQQNKIKSCAQRISNYFDKLFDNQFELPLETSSLPNNELNELEKLDKSKNSEVLFDIREIDSLMNLADDSSAINSDRETSNSNDAEVIQRTEDNTKNMNSDFPQPLKSTDIALAELKIDAKEQLSEFEQAVYELQVIPYAANAIQNIQKACSTLQETAYKLNDKNLFLVLNPLQTLIQKKLTKTEPVSEPILKLLNQTTDLIHTHLDCDVDDEKEIRKLGSKIEKILNVQSVKLLDQEIESKHLGSQIEDLFGKKSQRRNKIGSFLKRRPKK
ncbi:MAG: hypothetical protein ACE5IW_02905 [bacterium]